MKNKFPNADQDFEARTTIWNAICIASEEIYYRFNLKTVLGNDTKTISKDTNLKTVVTWRLIEALSLLGILLRSEIVEADQLQLFGKTGPIGIREDNINRYVWTQHTLHGEKSSLGGRPDLMVTSSSDLPNPNNVIRIIESKCVKNLGTHAIRSEFGKAYDLQVSTYIIWSFYSPAQRVIDGARRLGIDLEPLGFDTECRDEYNRSPQKLLSHIANFQEKAWREQNLSKAMAFASETARRKLLPPGR